ncbi:hypothetical protein VT84_32135 [Gemmata sp. SH-PL17]|uniref:hypothetical protein n=1 Tax=Gemmata sp. SH-PL17 TaxID=1630693 RepID=UPI00078ECB77|nr:hypothetical protein [Gemmata sp. SH-PL17]AMV29089.1 hypothetical protein VT84_32135 [Gemmata sp. SH-PL17]
MTPACALTTVLGLLCLTGFGTAFPADPDDTPKALRGDVLKATSSKDKAGAYQKLFEKVGRQGFADLTKDEVTGIALQAAWETYTKPAKRPKPLMPRTNDIYDPTELGKFVAFFKERTKAPVPEWWARGITDVDLFPGQHHAFIGSDTGPKCRESKSGALVPDGAEMEEKDGKRVYSVGGRTVEFPSDTFDELSNSFAGVVGEKRSAVAGYTAVCGEAFEIAGFEGRGGKSTWKADVWGTDRDFLGGQGYHWVEVREKDGTVFVFGAESHGMYAEAFDLATGKCQWRFCSCYWFHHSEKWKHN